MSVESGYNDMQREVNVDPEDLSVARKRRDTFSSALKPASDVVEVIPSGSLARGSHADPIHDVDLIVVYDAAKHPTWGDRGTSASESLSHLGGQVNQLLGATNGSHTNLVRRATPRNHAVKCFLDDPDDPDGFAVDVMPALRQADDTLLVPESTSNGWILTNPEYLIALVRERHRQWNEFVKLVRVLKRWNRDQGAIMKSLLVEVLALDCLNRASSRGRALAGYFTSANIRLGRPVCDPADLCGPIQPDLDVAAARAKLVEAANIAQKALDAEDRGDQKAAMCHWHELFGDVYPEPEGGCSSAVLAGAAAVTTAATVTSPRSGPRRVRDIPQG